MAVNEVDAPAPDEAAHPGDGRGHGHRRADHERLDGDAVAFDALAPVTRLVEDVRNDVRVRRPLQLAHSQREQPLGAAEAEALDHVQDSRHR